MAYIECNPLPWGTAPSTVNPFEGPTRLFDDTYAAGNSCATLTSMSGTISVTPSFFATVINSSADAEMIVHLIAISRYRGQRRIAVKNLLDFDMQDLAVMIGVASLSGAVLSESSNIIFGSPPAQALSLSVGLVAFVAGRVISLKLRRKNHG